MLRCIAQGWFEVTNAEPGQRALHAVDKPGAFLDQALALPIGPLGVLFGKRRYAHHAAMAPFAPPRWRKADSNHRSRVQAGPVGIYSLLIMKSLSAADSAPQTSPLRPASCRTLA